MTIGNEPPMLDGRFREDFAYYIRVHCGPERGDVFLKRRVRPGRRRRARNRPRSLGKSTEFER
jgi:hypothetical protein